MIHNKGTRGGPGPVLVNTSGIEGRGPCYTFPYPVFETAVLGLLKEVGPADVLPNAKGASRVEVLRADMAGLQADLRDGYSKALATLLREKEAQEEAAGKELHEELAKAARPAEKAWKDLPSLVDLIAKEGDEARIRIRPVLRRLIEGARALIARRKSWQSCAAQFWWQGGTFARTACWPRTRTAPARPH